MPFLCRRARGGNAGREIVDAEDTGSSAAAICSGPEPTGDCAEPAAEYGSGGTATCAGRVMRGWPGRSLKNSMTGSLRRCCIHQCRMLRRSAGRCRTGRLKPTLRQVHLAGERLFVDFAGQTMSDRRDDRGDPAHRDFRRRARGVEIHICRGCQIASNRTPISRPIPTRLSVRRGVIDGGLST